MYKLQMTKVKRPIVDSGNVRPFEEKMITVQKLQTNSQDIVIESRSVDVQAADDQGQEAYSRQWQCETI